jgi:hypothetical protein
VADVELPNPTAWGHESVSISPADVVRTFKEEAEHSITAFEALPDGPEPCNDKSGYCRVSVTIPLTPQFFDQLMNGSTGYRAHYSVSAERGEDFNRQLVDAITLTIVQAEHIYSDRFTRLLCQTSLCGRFTKLWFSKELTDPSAQSYLENLPEVLRVPRWKAYWQGSARPRKGLLAPHPDNASVLLNGSFVNVSGELYEQKPTRSEQLFNSGWT